MTEIDPYKAVGYSLGNRLARVLWAVAYVLFFRFTPRFFHGWRRFVLRCFGARLGRGTCVHASAKIWAPWNLVCEDMVAVAPGAEIYNPSLVWLGSHAIVSQNAYICGASHNHNDVAFPLYSREIRVGRYAWICARASLLPGVIVEEGAVLGLGSVASRKLDRGCIYAGVPAKKVGTRRAWGNFTTSLNG